MSILDSSPAPARQGRLAHLVDSDPFNLAIAAVIVANAVVLGLETFPAVMESYSAVLETLNTAFYLVFLAELILRILSYGRRPWDFFRNGWNVFDFIIIGGALIPGLRENAQILRLLRLARVVRLIRFLPDARVLIYSVARSLPPLGSIVVLTLLIVFIYGMVGWALFGQALPESWGTITKSMLTLFVLLTLENFPTYLQEASAVSPWAVVFFVSYVLVAAFVIFNLLIGIIIGSMEEARDREARQELAARGDRTAMALQRIQALRDSLDEIEADLRVQDDEARKGG